MLQIIHFRSFRKGTKIVTQHQNNYEVFILTKGEVTVEVDGELIYHLSRKGDIFGEMSVISGKPSTATNRATKPVEVVVISSKLLKLITGDIFHELNHIFYEWFSQILAGKLDLTTQKAIGYEILHKRFKLDLESARKVQQKILSTHLTSIPNLHLTVKCEFTDLLGGDFYGTLRVDEDHYGILIGDVAGHGAKASLLAVSVLSYFVNFSRAWHSPKKVLGQINDLCQAIIPENSFATVFYGVYHVPTRKLAYAYGGTPPALILRNKKASALTRGKGLPLGVFDSEKVNYEEKEFQLEQGDRLVIFTDALFECVSGKMEMLGMEKLFKIFEDYASLPAEEFVEAIYNYEQDYSGGMLDDDFTLMVFEQS